MIEGDKIVILAVPGRSCDEDCSNTNTGKIYTKCPFYGRVAKVDYPLKRDEKVRFTQLNNYQPVESKYTGCVCNREGAKLISDCNLSEEVQSIIKLNKILI